jgi:adenosylmethionine-8-amino-7-oxononanoate aminotransferase
MRTVTAHDDGDHEQFLPSAQLTNASRVTSVAMSLSDGLFGSGKDSRGECAAALDAQDVYVRNSVRRRIEDVREAICCALREALDERAEAGDVQTCAMVALVAEGVLRIGTQRVQLFVEAYIGTSGIIVPMHLELWC